MSNTQTITLMSRYGEPRYLEKIEDGLYRYYGKCSYMRAACSEDCGPDDWRVVDPDGGPYIEIGMFISEVAMVVRRITSVSNRGLDGCFEVFLHMEPVRKSGAD